MYYGLFVKLLKVYPIFIVDIRVNVKKISTALTAIHNTRYDILNEG